MDFNCFLPPFQIRSPNNEAREDFVFQNQLFLCRDNFINFRMNACLFNFCQFNCLQSSPTHLLVANLIQLLRSNPFFIGWRQTLIICSKHFSSMPFSSQSITRSFSTRQTFDSNIKGNQRFSLAKITTRKSQQRS